MARPDDPRPTSANHACCAPERLIVSPGKQSKTIKFSNLATAAAGRSQIQTLPVLKKQRTINFSNERLIQP